MKFDGFSEGNVPSVRFPEQFFRELLLEMDEAGELRLVLYVFWRLERMEGSFRYLRWSSLLADRVLLQSFAEREALEQALERAVGRGVLLSASLPLEGEQERLIFLN